MEPTNQLEDQLDDFLSKEKEAPELQKYAVRLIDIAIIGLIFYLVIFKLIPALGIITSENFNKIFVTSVMAGIILLRWLFISLFNGTPAMKLFKLKYLNGKEKPLTRAEKFAAACFVHINGADFYETVEEKSYATKSD